MLTWLVASNTSVHSHFMWKLKQFTILPERNLLICRAVGACEGGRGGSCTAGTNGRDKGTEKKAGQMNTLNGTKNMINKFQIFKPNKRKFNKLS